MIDCHTTVADLRAALAADRLAGRCIGLVPTMGALHAGHLSLVQRARAECDRVVVSIFVNPLQFGPGEDLDRYPRDLQGDLDLLDGEGVDAVFAPEVANFIAGQATTVSVTGLGDVLDGVRRPGHFDGVTTIVAKLCNAVGPQRAYFGEKDYQQLVIVRRMVADLALPVQIVGCPIVRDVDGVALSSRNAFLSTEQRRAATAIPAALAAVAQEWTGAAQAARQRLAAMIEGAPGLVCDYAEVVDPETLAPLQGVVAGPARALVAVFVGTQPRRTRLIDNCRLERHPATA